MIIPDDVRMSQYSEQPDRRPGDERRRPAVGPAGAQRAGGGWSASLILSGAVNTSIVGSNGVLNRVSEDGVLPDWFLKPHPRFGTTSRLINLVVILQIVTIVLSQGNVLTLGEAYAFGVVWSFVFMSLSMLVLRFKRPGQRDYKVPLNIKIGQYDVPMGMTLIFLVLAIAAVANLLTKEVATISGIVFTAAFYVVFWFSERGPPPPPGTDAARAPRAVQPERGRPDQRRDVEPDSPLPQAGGDPVAAQSGHAREVPQRNRPRDHRSRGHDRLGRPQGER